MSWDQLFEPGVVVRDSRVETDRFGRWIQRLTIGPGAVDADALLALIEDLTADVLVVRYDAARLELPSIFARSRWAVIPAGALTYWEQQVPVAPSASSPADWPAAASRVEVVSADTLRQEEVSALVRGMVRAMFSNYGSHYLSNPLLDPAAALAGYEDWAVQTLNNHPGNVLVMKDGREPVGLATLDLSADANHLEILLAGLVPSAQGKGLYGLLLASCESAAAARGARRVVISTQVHNLRVQRAWARRGLRPFGAIETVHLVNRDLLLALPGNGH
jgi:RimJ/RimL family protein N-acetyltransferase